MVIRSSYSFLCMLSYVTLCMLNVVQIFSHCDILILYYLTYILLHNMFLNSGILFSSEFLNRHSFVCLNPYPTSCQNVCNGIVTVCIPMYTHTTYVTLLDPSKQCFDTPRCGIGTPSRCGFYECLFGYLYRLAVLCALVRTVG